MTGSTPATYEMEIAMNTTNASPTEATVTPRGAHVAPKARPSKSRATTKKNVNRAARGAKKAKRAAPKALVANATRKPLVTNAAKPEARPGSKKELVLALLRRPEGATLAEIRNQTTWAAHSVRGFISTMAKKLGVPIESTRNAGGERLYRIP